MILTHIEAALELSVSNEEFGLKKHQTLFDTFKTNKITQNTY